MKEELENVLSRETQGFRNLCNKLATGEVRIVPSQVKFFFDFVIHISSETLLMEKYAYGQVKIHESSESMVYGLPKEKKELLENQLAEMTQISAPENRFGIPQTTTHYDLLSDLYKSLGYGRADMLAIEYQNRENPYLLELMLVSTLYKAAKQ